MSICVRFRKLKNKQGGKELLRKKKEKLNNKKEKNE